MTDPDTPAPLFGHPSSLGKSAAPTDVDHVFEALYTPILTLDVAPGAVLTKDAASVKALAQTYDVPVQALSDPVDRLS